MLNDSPLEAEFSALLRCYLIRRPADAEAVAWAVRDVRALPPEKFKNERWFQRENESGIIHIDEQRNGQWFDVVPHGVDPESIVCIPKGSAKPTLLERMQGISDQLALVKPKSGIKALVRRLDKLSQPTHPLDLLAAFGGLGIIALNRGPDALLAYLSDCASRVNDILLDGQLTGCEAGAILLIDSLVKEIFTYSNNFLHMQDHEFCGLLSHLLSPGIQSIEEMAQRFVHTCFQLGLSSDTLTAIDRLRRKGDEMVRYAQRGLYPDQSDLILPFYYLQIFLAAIYFNAASAAYETLSLVKSESDAQRSQFKRLANACEEKHVRLSTAMLYALDDLKSQGLNFVLNEFKRLIANGKIEAAESLAMSYIELNLYYPRPFRRAFFKFARMNVNNPVCR